MHCHLELSDVPRPISFSGSFTDWAAQILQHRRQRAGSATRLPSPALQPTASSGLSPREQADAVRTAVAAGLDESAQAGVGVVWDIASDRSGVCYPPYHDVAVVALAELIAINDERCDASWHAAEELFELLQDRGNRNVFTGQGGLAAVGLSPHAPYTIDRRLLEQVCRRSADERLPVAIHLAETAAELRWLAGEANEFSELRTRFGNRPAHSEMDLSQIIDLLGTAYRVLLIHGNYLRPRHLDQIAATQRIGVVYCPRTAVGFGHPHHPITECLDRGIPVFLGTDSRASSPDLDLRREATTLLRRHRDIDAAWVWAAMTDAPRKFFGDVAVGDELLADRGRVAIGGCGPWLSIALPSGQTGELDLYELLAAPGRLQAIDFSD